jgi:hypothetical protein
MNAWMRKLHRWLSIVFTLAVILNIACMFRKDPPMWVGFLALVPLIPMLLSGLYLFALPYMTKARRSRGALAAE